MIMDRNIFKKNSIKENNENEYEQTCRWWLRVFLLRCRYLSHSAHKLPHVEHSIIAGVSESS